MRMRADIATCENGRDKILSVCQLDADGEIAHEITIQRSPKEYDIFDENPGPKISCDELGLDLATGPQAIRFAGNTMVIVLAQCEDIEADLSPLTPEERADLRNVAEKLFA